MQISDASQQMKSEVTHNFPGTIFSTALVILLHGHFVMETLWVWGAVSVR